MLLGPPRKSGASPRRQCQPSRWRLPTQATTLSRLDPVRWARLVLPHPSTGGRPPGRLRWGNVAPEPTHLRVGLEDVVLDPALGAELLGTQQAAVLPHQVVPLQDRRPTPTCGAGDRRQQGQAPRARVAALCGEPLTRAHGSRPACAHAGEEPRLAGLVTDAGWDRGAPASWNPGSRCPLRRGSGH